MRHKSAKKTLAAKGLKGAFEWCFFTLWYNFLNKTIIKSIYFINTFQCVYVLGHTKQILSPTWK